MSEVPEQSSGGSGRDIPPKLTRASNLLSRCVGPCTIRHSLLSSRSGQKAMWFLAVHEIRAMLQSSRVMVQILHDSVSPVLLLIGRHSHEKL